jgi:hypothetical protein
LKKPDAHRYRIFISSVQKELAAERRALKEGEIHEDFADFFPEV